MMPLVSVIIPVYKVEPYLARCVRSVCTQTYDNLEIILVDDGSPDRCGIMCDNYAKEDSRIVVIHQNNMGLSGARNTGLDTCNGEYVLFADSDDWIERDMVSDMIEAILRNKADVCCCGYYDRSNGKEMMWQGFKEEQLLRGENILTAFVNESIISTAWGKLWKINLFYNDTKFPLGKNYEDIATTWKRLSACDTAVCIPQILYHYETRPGSITKNRSLANINDYWKAYIELYQALGQKEEWREKLLLKCLIAVGYVWRWYYSAEREIRQTSKAKPAFKDSNENRESIINTGIELRKEVHQFALKHKGYIRKRKCPFNITITTLLACHNNKCSLLICHLLNQIYRAIYRISL